MTHTYDPDLTTNSDKVRFHIGDTVEDSGPRPSDDNFSDEELDALVSANGTWQRAVAAALRVLATEWTRYPSFQADGLRLDRTAIAKGYIDQAATWEKRFGIPVPVVTAGIIRVDGYSDDITNDDVDVQGEYGHKFEYVTPR